MSTPRTLAGSFADSFRGAGWTPKLVVSLISLVFLFETVNLQYIGATTVLPLVTNHYQTAHAAWVLTIYALVGAVTAPTVGKLADRFGKRTMLFTVMAISAIGSFIVATAATFEIVLVGRALEGFLIAAGFLNYSLVRDVYPPKTVPFAAAVTLTGTGVLSIFAPTVLGSFIDTYGFRSVFVVNGVLAAVLIGIIAATTPETTVRSKSSIDGLGAFLIAVAIGSVLTGISMGTTWGWSSVRTVGLVTVGIVVGILYAVYSLRRREPILDIRMFTRRGVQVAAVISVAVFSAQTVGFVLVSIIGLTPSIMGGGYGLGLTATELAQITTPAYIVGLIGALAAGMAIRAIGPGNTSRIGLVAFALGLTLLAFRHDSVVEMAIGMSLFLIGSGACMGSIPNLVMSAAPNKEQASYSSGLQLVQSTIGAAAPVVVFLVLGRDAFAGPGGATVYTDSSITAAYLGCLALVLVALIIISTVLRPKAQDVRDIEVTDLVQRDLLAAELGDLDELVETGSVIDRTPNIRSADGRPEPVE